MRKGHKSGLFLLLIFIILSAPGFAADKQGCLVRMIDNLNMLDVLLESLTTKTENGAVLYSVTSEFSSQTPWTVEVTVPSDKDAPIITGAGVPELSMYEIRNGWLLEGLVNDGYAKQDTQLTWIIESNDSSCSDNDLALIVFLVHEWFFFG